MSTVEKALEVLGLFSESQPALGLSEAARLLNRDKATTQRHLSALLAHGFLEQDPLTRLWHLGPALTRLALVRDKSWPVESSVRNIVAKLVAETGETCHVSHFAGGQLHNVLILETSVRGTRVYVDPSQPLPLHATASGIAYLSALPDPTDALDLHFDAYTDATPTSRAQVVEEINAARSRGYSRSLGTYETDVVGIAASLAGRDNKPVGSIAVATPRSRFGDTQEQRNAALLIDAAHAISRAYGAQYIALRAAE